MTMTDKQTLIRELVALARLAHRSSMQIKIREMPNVKQKALTPDSKSRRRAYLFAARLTKQLIKEVAK